MGHHRRTILFLRKLLPFLSQAHHQRTILFLRKLLPFLLFLRVKNQTPLKNPPKNAKKDKDPLSCEDYGEALEAKCNKHYEWIKEKYCQLSCYLIGKGYEGDVCCLNEEITI